MSLGYLCVTCGWMESTHIFGKDSCREQGQEYLDEILPGRCFSFRSCPEYQPSAAEKAAAEQLNAQGLERM